MGSEGGEQVAVLRATPNCSEAEWEQLSAAISNSFRLKI
jgi:hypothetical protein